MAGAAVVWSLATGVTAWIDRSPILPPALQLHLPLFGVLVLSSVALGLCCVRAVVGVGESFIRQLHPL